MARNPVVSPEGTTTPPDPRMAVVEALMRLAAGRRWSEIELGDIAAESGLSLSTMRGLFPSKLAMLGGFIRMIDDVVLAGASDELAGEPARERMFDLVMRRLDAMTPYKQALRRIVPALRGDPPALAALNGAALNSWRYMLASAGIPTSDPLGAVKLQGAVLLMARVTETWLDDDEAELSRTMARLDRELKTAGWVLSRAEDVYRLTGPFRGLARALCSGRRPARRRRERAPVSDDEDYAPAI